MIKFLIYVFGGLLLRWGRQVGDRLPRKCIHTTTYRQQTFIYICLLSMLRGFRFNTLARVLPPPTHSVPMQTSNT